jgi:hypothetical protein
VEKLKPSEPDSKEAILQLSLDIHRFANEKYIVFRKMWTEFDIFSVCMSICFSFWLLVHFFFYGVMDQSIKFSKVSIFLLVFFYLNILADFNVLFGSGKASLFVMLATCFFMIEVDITQCQIEVRKLQNAFGFILILLHTIMNFSEAMMTEADTMYESFTAALLAATFLFQTGGTDFKLSSHRRSYVMNYLVILACVKISFFFDREKSLNFQEDPTLKAWKEVF